MFGHGRILVYSASVTRQLVADDVIAVVNTVPNLMFLILQLYLHQYGNDQLNEPNAIEVLRLTGGQGGGQVMTVKNYETGDPVASLGLNGIDADDWSTPPTPSTVMGGARPFNLSSGWRWAFAGTSPIVITNNNKVGFRIVDTISAVASFNYGVVVQQIDVG